MNRFSPSSSSGALVLGMMSGTSADGVDVALVRMGRSPGSARLEGFSAFPFPREVRAAILRLANGAPTATREISQLNFRLGEIFADAALAACRKFRIAPREVSLIGSHGQTIFHQGAPNRFLGAQIASTLQIGEPSVIAARTSITTIADFRPADMAAGGQGAPLVPFVDYFLYRHARHGRIALNIGGIANVTAIPAGARAEDVFAFDTGPGNMILDALASYFTNGRLRCDRDARMARKGRLVPELLRASLKHSFFRMPPPKTAGREEFGEEYARQWIARARRSRISPADLLHTATGFTALTIAEAIARFVLPRCKVHELIIAGGGARNPLIVAYLVALLPKFRIVPADAFGIPAQAKEAFAFAILAYEARRGRPNNLPCATGARRPAIMGKLCYARQR